MATGSESPLHSTFIRAILLPPEMFTRPRQDVNDSLFVLRPLCNVIRVRTPPVTLLIDVINANTSSWRKPLSLRVTAQNPAIPYRFQAYFKKKKIYIYIYKKQKVLILVFFRKYFSREVRLLIQQNAMASLEANHIDKCQLLLEIIANTYCEMKPMCRQRSESIVKRKNLLQLKKKRKNDIYPRHKRR